MELEHREKREREVSGRWQSVVLFGVSLPRHLTYLSRGFWPLFERGRRWLPTRCERCLWCTCHCSALSLSRCRQQQQGQKNRSTCVFESVCVITVSDGGSKKCQHVGPTRTHSHSHSHARIRCEFHFDLTNRKSFIPHTQCCPLSAFPHALQIVSSSTRFDFVNFRSLSLSQWFPPTPRPLLPTRFMRILHIFFVLPSQQKWPIKASQLQSRVMEHGMSCRETRFNFHCETFMTLFASASDFLTFIECKLFCNNVIESLAAPVYWCVYFVSAGDNCLHRKRDSSSNFVCDFVKYFPYLNAVPQEVK